MYDLELVIDILNQINVAAKRIERRFSNIGTAEDFLATEDGLDMLDAICMMLIAIGEALKQLDKITAFQLLPKYQNRDNS